MKSKKIAVSLIVVICVTWIVAVLYYGKLPEKIPSHWNIDGEINGYMTKPWGVYMFPLMSTVLSVILWFLPKVAPKGFKLDSARKAYNIRDLCITFPIKVENMLKYRTRTNS